MKKCVFLFILIFFVSCDPYDDRLTIINRTNQSIVISDRLWSKDTSIYNNKIAIDNFEFYEYQVLPYSSKKITTSGSWNKGFKNDTLVILIYNKEAILKKRVEKPSENYDIEQIIYVSHNYIKRNDWKININPKKTSQIIKL